MDEQERQSQGMSFGSVAQAYAQHRPDYPQEAVRWALAPAAQARGAAEQDVAGLQVLDLGAGTGKLTQVLLSAGAQVTAVEPDAAMLAQLRSQFPAARALSGSAEEIPLPDRSVDAVLAGQALHWFDMSRALPQIARVLRPGGTLAALWNADDDRVEWVRELQGLYRDAGSPSLKRRREDVAHFPETQFGPSFGPAQSREFSHHQRLTAQSLLDLLQTHSKMIVMPAAQRTAVLAEVRDYLARLPQAAAGEFDLPLVTVALRAVRTGD